MNHELQHSCYKMICEVRFQRNKAQLESREIQVYYHEILSSPSSSRYFLVEIFGDCFTFLIKSLFWIFIYKSCLNDNMIKDYWKVFLIFLLCSFADDSPSHVPIAPINIDSRIIELELEKCRLETQLSTAVNQEEFLALKETLEDTKEAQTSYKVNC